MTANHKNAHISNVRERRAERLAREAEAGPVEAPKPLSFDNSVEVDGDEGAQSEPQASDSADSESETDTQGFEKPITLGGIDG